MTYNVFSGTLNPTHSLAGLSAACDSLKYRTQKGCKNWPSAHHLTTLSGYIFAIKACINNGNKNLLNTNISSTSPHNMVNFNPLMAETGWRVWSTPANFNGVSILASLLQRHRSIEVNQTLHNVWPFAGLVYIFGGSCPQWNSAKCKIHFMSKSRVLLFWQRYCTALEQWASSKLCGMVQ